MSAPVATRSPLVSVIIPAYNSAAFVLQAVQSALDQTYGNYEVIVVDDGSTDDTKLVLSRFDGQFRYLYQPNRGLSAARNAGIALAKGDFVCFLDADDLWAPDKVELQVAYMERHRDIALLSTGYEHFTDDGAVAPPLYAVALPVETAARTFTSRDDFVKFVSANFIFVSTVMVRKDCFDKSGLFDTNLRAAEDRDMWLRISAHFDIACLPPILVRKRNHSLNMSKDRTRQIRSRIQVLEKNRALFPELAPSSAWDKQLGKLYLRTAYDSLSRDQSKEARRAALRSLRYYPSIKAAVLVLATCTAR